jgi:hypothetical protein
VGLVGVPHRKDSKGLQLQTPLKVPIEPKRHSGAVTNRTESARGTALVAESAAIAILVSPIRTSPGRFQARREGTDELLVDSSRQPFVDAARVLVGKGYNPAGVLEMKHQGSDIIALRASLGKAARLSVEEGVNGPRFVPLRKGLKPCVDAPPIASGMSAASEVTPAVPRTGSPATHQNGQGRSQRSSSPTSRSSPPLAPPAWPRPPPTSIPQK